MKQKIDNLKGLSFYYQSEKGWKKISVNLKNTKYQRTDCLICKHFKTCETAQFNIKHKFAKVYSCKKFELKDKTG